MRTILRDLESLSGVRCGYVVRNGVILASTFPAGQSAALAASQELTKGVVEGLALVDRGWEELLVDLGETLLMVLPVNDGFTLALLTGAEANVDLLRVVMQSSVRQIRTMMELPPAVPTPAPAPPVQKPAPPPPPPPPPKPVAPPPPPPPKPAPPPPQAAKPAPPPPQPAAPARQPPPPPRPAAPQQGRPSAPPQPAAPAKPAPAAPPAAGKQAPPPPKPGAAPPPKPQTPAQPAPPAAAAARSRNDEDAEPLLPKVLDLLMGSIGPVARVTFKRGLARWKESHAPTIGNLSSLAEILAADLSSDEEKRSFVGAVERLRGN